MLLKIKVNSKIVKYELGPPDPLYRVLGLDSAETNQYVLISMITWNIG